MSTRELKQERSIPVQSRIDIKSLAELDIYWTSIGVDIRSMSQLISWSVDAFHEVLKNNEMLPDELETVAECHVHMEDRRLYQGSMKKRAISKVNAAMRFENLRFEGVDPSGYDSREYNIVHNKQSVKPYPGIKRKRSWRDDPTLTKEQREHYERAERMEVEERERLQKEETERQKANAMKSGRVVVVEHEGESLEEKHARQAMENQRRIEEDDMMPPGYDE